MKIIVAGSSGLIGSELVPALRRGGHDVIRLVRRPTNAADERTWDPPAARIEDGALDGADAVINLCGVAIPLARLSGARKQALVDSRVEPTEVLAAAVAEHRIPLLVNANAVGYYGDRGTAEIDESTPAGTGFLSTMCTEWEAATRAAKDAGARVVILRTGLVLAPRGGLLAPLRMIFSLMLGGRLGDGRQYMPWIHHEDEIAAILFTLTNPITGPVNLAAPNPVTNAEFTRVLAQVLGRPAPWVVPKFALRAVLGTELADDGALASQRIVPKVLQDNGFTFGYSSIEPALRSVR